MGRKTLALLCVLVVGVSGCVVAAVTAVAAGVVYVSGEAKKSYVATVEETRQATVKAMEQMGLPDLGASRDGDGWQFRSRRPSDAAEVKVRIRRGGESLTEVGVRVGTLGDREYSTKLLEAIEKNL